MQAQLLYFFRPFSSFLNQTATYFWLNELNSNGLVLSTRLELIIKEGWKGIEEDWISLNLSCYYSAYRTSLRATHVQVRALVLSTRACFGVKNGLQ